MKEKIKYFAMCFLIGLLCCRTGSVCQAQEAPEEALMEYYESSILPVYGEIDIEDLTSYGVSGIVSHTLLDTNKDSVPELLVCHYNENGNFEIIRFEIDSAGVINPEIAYSVFFMGNFDTGEYEPEVIAGHKGCFFVDNGEKVTFAMETTAVKEEGGWTDRLTLNSREPEPVDEANILAEIVITFDVDDTGASAIFDGYLDGVRYWEEKLCDVDFVTGESEMNQEEKQKVLASFYSECSKYLEPVGIQLTDAKKVYTDIQELSLDSMVDVKSFYEPYKDANTYYLFDWKYSRMSGYEQGQTKYE